METAAKVETKRSIYTITEGTGIYWGPIGTPQGQFRETANILMKVTPLIKEKHQGHISFWVEVESPPERRGDHFWVEKLIAEKGFLKT